jgi:hypothetical protein
MIEESIGAQLDDDDKDPMIWMYGTDASGEPIHALLSIECARDLIRELQFCIGEYVGITDDLLGGTDA